MANSLANDDARESKLEALQRLVFIKALYEKYKSTVKTTFLIGEELREQRYRKVIQDTNSLHQTLNKEFCDLIIVPQNAEFVIQKLSSETTQSSLAGYINSVYKSVFIMTSSNLHDALQRFTVILKATIGSKLIIRPNERRLLNVDPDELENDKLLITTQQQQQPSQPHELTLFDKLDDAESAKIGMLKERELWLRHLIGMYSIECKQFIMDPQNYEIYKQELESVNSILMMHSKQYK
jgi:hypothetical protein